MRAVVVVLVLVEVVFGGGGGGAVHGVQRADGHGLNAVAVLLPVHVHCGGVVGDRSELHDNNIVIIIIILGNVCRGPFKSSDTCQKIVFTFHCALTRVCFDRQAHLGAHYANT